MKKIILASVLTFNLYANYSIVPSKREYSALDTMPKGSVADMHNIPQNLSYYAKQIKPVSDTVLKQKDREFNYKFFSPWRQASFNEPKKDASWAFRMLKKRKDLYQSRRILISQASKNYWIENSNMSKFDTIRLKAITVTDSSLRAVPTSTRIFLNPQKRTEGFPFDYNQNSEIHLNVPLYISHFSKDKKWALVHSAAAYGWIKTSDIALTDSNFMRTFKSGKYGVVIRDNSKLLSNGRKIAHLKMGTIFPIKRGSLLFAKRVNAYAKIAKLKRVHHSIVATKPLKFVPQNVAYIASQLKGEPYAWGGLLHGRDCSSTTRDFFACFGIFLPRNSSHQARVGNYISIKSVKGRAKKNVILRNAKPFRSLLFVPGHIGIYIGKYKNEPVIMHTYWGVRLKNFSKYRLSRTIITTLQPGNEKKDLRQKSKMSNTLKAVINLL